MSWAVSVCTIIFVVSTSVVSGTVTVCVSVDICDSPVSRVAKREESSGTFVDCVRVCDGNPVDSVSL